MAIRENAPPPRRLSLRHAAINYRAGWWSVTVQVAKNKSLLGAVVGEQVALNALGRAVEAAWRALPGKYPELEIFDFVVMPNHFHALLRIHWRATNRAHHLGFLMSRFKGGTSFAYGQMRRAGEIEDIGESLWQRDYWDDLVTSEAEFRGWQKYIRENPANWSSDRYGACMAHLRGNAELLNRPRVAFVASQGFYASALRPRKVWARAEAGRLRPPPSITMVGQTFSSSPRAAAPLPPAASLSERAALAAPSTAPSAAPSPAPARRGQALIELAAGLFALALVVSALCGFALYIAKSLRLQNELRVGGQKTDSVEVSAFAAEHVFGGQKLKISEKLAWPQTTVVR